METHANRIKWCVALQITLNERAPSSWESERNYSPVNSEWQRTAFCYDRPHTHMKKAEAIHRLYVLYFSVERHGGMSELCAKTKRKNTDERGLVHCVQNRQTFEYGTAGCLAFERVCVRADSSHNRARALTLPSWIPSHSRAPRRCVRFHWLERQMCRYALWAHRLRDM